MDGTQEGRQGRVESIAGNMGRLYSSVPVDAVFDWDSSNQPGFRLKLAWLFGLVSFAPHRKMGEKEKPAPREKVKGKNSPRLGTIPQIIRIEGLFKKVKDLIGSSIRQIKVKELKADIRLGLDDPADAGLAFATSAVIAPWLSFSRLRHVRIVPVFGEEVSLQGKARTVIRLQPIRLAPPFLSFVFSRPAWSLFRTMAAQRS